MKIYKIIRDLDNTTDYAEFQISSDSSWAGSLLFMNKNEHKYELPISYVTMNKNRPTDYPYSYNNIVSEQFMDVIKQMNTSYEALDSVVFYGGKNLKSYCLQSGNPDGRIWGMFYTVIFPEFELFNWDKSIFVEKNSKVSGKRIVTNLQKLVLDHNQLNKQIKNLQNNNFFVLSEKPIDVLCTEKAKQAIEDAGLTGIAFEEVPIE